MRIVVMKVLTNDISTVSLGGNDTDGDDSTVTVMAVCVRETEKENRKIR